MDRDENARQPGETASQCVKPNDKGTGDHQDPNSARQAARPRGGATAAAEKLSVRELFVAHHHALMRFLKRRLPDREQAEDMAQEVYYRLARRPGIRQIEHQKAFLMQTAKNLLKDHARYCRRRPGEHLDIEQLQEELPPSADSPERTAAADQEIALLGAALQELGPKCRAVFTLHKIDGASYQKISDDLGISLSMVEKHISRAMRHLRKRLSEIRNDPERLSRSKDL